MGAFSFLGVSSTSRSRKTNSPVTRSLSKGISGGGSKKNIGPP